MTNQNPEPDPNTRYVLEREHIAIVSENEQLIEMLRARCQQLRMQVNQLEERMNMNTAVEPAASGPREPQDRRPAKRAAKKTAPGPKKQGD